jgi:hypothetical protein
MRRLLLFIVFLFLTTIGCRQKNCNVNIDKIAGDYVKIALNIGQYDPDFVDAYYGPDSLKPTKAPLKTLPKDSILGAVKSMILELDGIVNSSLTTDTVRIHAKWITDLLKSFVMRIHTFSGELSNFDEESLQLFGVQAPIYNEKHYQSLISELERVLPGSGSTRERYQALAGKFTIPKDKIDVVFKTAISEARKRTNTYCPLPPDESFTVEYVSNKPWIGYNWYKGNYQSLIQVNTDFPINIVQAIILACHEGYPGHHVFNMMLEKELYRSKGWVDVSLNPLFTPLNLIAEGHANYGIDMVFPDDEFRQFMTDVLLPAAGLDTLNACLYYKAFLLKNRLDYALKDIARGIIDGTMNDVQVKRWQSDFELLNEEEAAQQLRFIKHYRSYMICYSYGQDLIRNYVENHLESPITAIKRWQVYSGLFGKPVTPAELMTVK